MLFIVARAIIDRYLLNLTISQIGFFGSDNQFHVTIKTWEQISSPGFIILLCDNMLKWAISRFLHKRFLLMYDDLL
jgi:hypothetical protein